MNAWTSLNFGPLRWLVRPAWQERLFNRTGLRLEEWRSSQAVHIVKQAEHRTVYRIALPDEAIYVKHYPVNDLRGFLRQRLRPPKARTEMERALALAERAVPTIEPIAVAETTVGESYLVTRDLPGTARLDEFLNDAVERATGERLRLLRIELARRLADFLARLHDAGVRHDDLHPGNLLIHPQSLALYLIDLHAVRLAGPLDWPRSRDNLAQLSAWFFGRSSRTDRRRFWRQYVGCRQDSAREAEREQARELECVTNDTCSSIWQSRQHRCLAGSRHFYQVQAAGCEAWAVGDLPRDLLDLLVSDPDRPFHSGTPRRLKDGRSATVVEFNVVLDGHARRVVYKRFRSLGWSDSLTYFLRSTAAMRAWVNGHVLLDRGLPTARPLALLQRSRHGLAQDAYLLMEKLDGTVDLRDYLDHLPPWDHAERRRLAERVAGLVRGLHDRQLGNRDLKASNILVETARCRHQTDQALAVPFRAAPRLFLIDLVGVERRRRLPRQRKIQNLARLHASFHGDARITRSDKLRFLRSYLRWGIHGKQGWKQWWREIAAATVRKIAQNRRRGRPLG